MIKSLFLFRFVTHTELIWQDALLIDFAQKKTVHKWIQKFLINAAYIFNERLVFEFLVRFGIDYFFQPLNKLSILEATNLINLLTWFIALIFFFVLSLTLAYLSLFFL